MNCDVQLGAIAVRKRNGKTRDEDIAVFEATAMAKQDTATSYEAYKTVRRDIIRDANRLPSKSDYCLLLESYLVA
jgi:ornithine cyclodeaminase/alanine dehydrogenase-like protein (mu-crystallin family)